MIINENASIGIQRGTNSLFIFVVSVFSVTDGSGVDSETGLCSSSTTFVSGTLKGLVSATLFVADEDSFCSPISFFLIHQVQTASCQEPLP